MISKQYFEETFSLATAQALQTWANDNLIAPSFGDYAMRIDYADNGGDALMFEETALVGLTIGDDVTLRLYMADIVSNAFKIYINTLPNDNTSAVYELGWGEGWRELTFEATATTMYLAIGDNNPAAGTTYSIVDNVSAKQNGSEFITNGTFEAGNTDGWDGQSVNTVSSVYQYVVEPPLPGDNPYLEAVNIPEYDGPSVGGSNTSHVLIPDDELWSEATLNNASFTNFYIRPGENYTTERLSINASGTDVNRRTVSLYTPDDLHPGQKLEAENAQIYVRVNGDYWTFDRMSVYGKYNYTYIINGTHNIINRMYSDGGGIIVVLTGNADDNTVQNSRFENSATYDDVAINIASWGNLDYTDADGHTHYSCFRSKIISNEFVDYGDGWQCTVTPIVNANPPTGVYERGNVGGTVVFDNDFYVITPLEKENATDNKCGSPDIAPDAAHDNDIDNPYTECIIANNRAWGYDTTQSSSANSAIICSMSVNGWKIYNNVVFDSTRAFSGGSNRAETGIGSGYIDSEMYGNIIFRCGSDSTNIDYQIGMSYASGNNQNIHDNYFIEPKNDVIAKFGSMTGGSVFTDNRVVTPLAGSFSIFDRPDEPSNSTFLDSLATTYEQARTGFTDYKFYKDKYTNSPTLVTLTEVLDPNGSIVSPV